MKKSYDEQISTHHHHHHQLLLKSLRLLRMRRKLRKRLIRINRNQSEEEVSRVADVDGLRDGGRCGM